MFCLTLWVLHTSALLELTHVIYYWLVPSSSTRITDVWIQPRFKATFQALKTRRCLCDGFWVHKVQTEPHWPSQPAVSDRDRVGGGVRLQICYWFHHWQKIRWEKSCFPASYSFSAHRETHQLRHFCCHKQFRFRSHLSELARSGVKPHIYVAVNDTCPPITVCDKCLGVQPKASGAQVAFNTSILSVSTAASLFLTGARK